MDPCIEAGNCDARQKLPLIDELRFTHKKLTDRLATFDAAINLLESYPDNDEAVFDLLRQAGE